MKILARSMSSEVTEMPSEHHSDVDSERHFIIGAHFCYSHFIVDEREYIIVLMSSKIHVV